MNKKCQIMMLDEAIFLLQRFMERGGIVLWCIAVVAIMMWLLICERFFYYHTFLKTELSAIQQQWKARQEHTSWYAFQIRNMLLSSAYLKINHKLAFLKTLIALCPLLGLLGTVTGMIEAFHVMAVTQGGEGKLMTDSIAKAVIPAMTGMSVALSGIFAHHVLRRMAQHHAQKLEGHLFMEDS